MSADWTPARRLFQVRLALEVLHLPTEHREGMEELASNLERKYTEKSKRKIERTDNGIQTRN